MATIGTIILMPKSVTLRDYTVCNGRALDASKESLLVAVIGNEFGDSRNPHKLPNLPDKFGFHHLLCVSGTFSRGVRYTVDFDDENFIGTVVPFEGDTIPDGWALCDGTTHPQTDNYALASVLGTHGVVGKAQPFCDMPKTGSERYIICVKGVLPS